MQRLKPELYEPIVTILFGLESIKKLGKITTN